MNTLDTLYFPDTVLPLHQQLPLALFFNTIHLLQPVEQDEKKDRDEPSAAGTATGSYPFMETGFCQVHTPSSLGADRDRFLHLLHDIRTRKDSYVEQLSYLSLASLSAPANRGDNSKQAILSSLLQGIDKNVEANDQQERLALWQSRLVLKIAEILDQEEEELALQLATIDDREIALFRSLQGEMRESGEEESPGEDPFKELLELRQKMSQPRPGMIKNRFRAWSRLYRSGPLPENFSIWTTRRQEAADVLLEQYEKECGQAPSRLLQIDLPARFNGEEHDEAGRVAQFRIAMQPHLQELAVIFGDLMVAETAASSERALFAPSAEAWMDVWNTKLEASFPARQYGRVELTFHFLAGMPLSALCGEAGGPGTKSQFRNGMLAVCV